MMATITKISFFLSKKILLERRRLRLRLALDLLELKRGIDERS